MPLETEVKFILEDVAPVKSRLLALKARPAGRCFETNLRFEDDSNSLIAEKSLLRLRRDHRATLTYKSTPASANRQFKIHQELEVEIADFQTMRSILESLGFHVEQKYEKWRETLTLGSTTFCLDIMPFGKFLEIEGAAEDIRHFSYQLGFDWSSRILLNYLEIFDIVRTDLQLRFNDVTFDNFQSVDISVAALMDRLKAGKTG